MTDRPTKRLEKFIDQCASWAAARQPRLRDEPQAYKMALLRMGAETALRAKLDEGFFEAASVGLDELIEQAERRKDHTHD